MKEEKTTKKHRGWVIFKRITGVVLILIFLVVAAAGALVGYLSLREYKPGDIEAVTVEGEGGKNCPVW